MFISESPICEVKKNEYSKGQCDEAQTEITGKLRHNMKC